MSARRDRVIRVCLTAAEADLLRAAAAKDGRTTSAWIRRQLLQTTVKVEARKR